MGDPTLAPASLLLGVLGHQSNVVLLGIWPRPKADGIWDALKVKHTSGAMGKALNTSKAAKRLDRRTGAVRDSSQGGGQLDASPHPRRKSISELFSFTSRDALTNAHYSGCLERLI